MVSEAYQEAQNLLTKNREKLEILANRLLEKETMDGRDVEKLIRGEEAEEPSKEDGKETEELA